MRWWRNKRGRKTTENAAKEGEQRSKNSTFLQKAMKKLSFRKKTRLDATPPQRRTHLVAHAQSQEFFDPFSTASEVQLDDPVSYDTVERDDTKTITTDVSLSEEFSESALESETEEALLANRYRILPLQLTGSPNCRLAFDEKLNIDVFVKFYPKALETFHRTVQLYHLMRPDKYVCRLLEAFENAEGFPPCLVFERGSCTLAEHLTRIVPSVDGQRATLQEVLEALQYIHRQGIVHGRVTPVNVMWFSSDFRWKLVGMDKATGPADGTSLHEVRGRHAAPEILQALKSGDEMTHVTPSVDMWSFGVTCFEFLTQSSVIDSELLEDYMMRRLRALFGRERPERPAGRHSAKSDIFIEDQNFRFIRGFLHREAIDRMTASEALGDMFFLSVPDLADSAEEQKSLSAYVPGLGFAPQWPDWLWNHILYDHVRLSLKVECFTKRSNPSEHFIHRESKETLRFYDDFLTHHPIHVMRLGHDISLGITVQIRHRMAFPVERVSAVYIHPPDDEVQELPIYEWRLNRTLEARALLRPTQFRSPKMNRISPSFGDVDRKYVKLAAEIRILLGGKLRKEVSLYHFIYCRIVRPRDKLRVQRYLRLFENQDAFFRPE